ARQLALFLDATDDQGRDVGAKWRKGGGHYLNNIGRELRQLWIEDGHLERGLEALQEALAALVPLQANDSGAGRVGQAVQIERFKARAQRDREEGDPLLDQLATQVGAIVGGEWAGDAHAIAQVEDDPAAVAVDLEAVVADGVLQRLFEIGRPGGILLLEGLEDGVKFVILRLLKEVLGERRGVDVDGPDGGAILVAEVLDDGLGDFPGGQKGTAVLAGGSVDQDQEVTRPQILGGFKGRRHLPAEDRVVVTSLVDDDLLLGE